MSLPYAQISFRGYAPLIAALIAAAITLFSPPVLNDGDTWWHLATGLWIFAHHQVPHTDPFSYTMPGHPWQAHEWLSEVLMAAAYRVADWSGVMILFALAAGKATWMVTQRVSRILDGIPLILVVTIALLCVGPSLLARPHILVLPVLALWMLEMLAARDANRAPHLWFAFLIIPWANLHGSFVFGYLLLGAFGLEALIAGWAERWKVIREWGLFAAISVACALVTPTGVQGLIFPFQLMTMTGLQSIAEWHSADFANLSAFEVAILGTLFVCLYRGVRVPLVRLTTLLFLLHMSLQHSRHLLVLAVVGPMLLAEPLAEALGHRPSPGPLPRLAWIGAAIAILVFGVARLAFPLVRTDRENTPITAFAHIPPDLFTQPVLNEYSLGGYLIFRGVRPYIDGRADMYGDAFLAEFLQATRPTPIVLERILRQRHITWTILGRHNRAVPWFDAQPNWRRIYIDRYVVVHVLQPGARPATAPVCPPTTPGRPQAPAVIGTSAPPSTTR